jgi:hypothetical protein
VHDVVPCTTVHGAAREVHVGLPLLSPTFPGGFILVTARDAEAAVELAKGCPVLDHGGTVEVWPIPEGDGWSPRPG